MSKKKQKPRVAVKLILFQKLLLRNPTTSPTEIAMRTYKCKNRLVAAVIACQNLIKLNISIAELMTRTPGMSDEDDLIHLERLKNAKKIQSCNVFVKKDKEGNYKINENSNDFVEVDDNKAQLGALNLSMKLKGHLRDKVELTGKDGEVLKVIFERAKPPKEKSGNKKSGVAKTR